MTDKATSHQKVDKNRSKACLSHWRDYRQQTTNQELKAPEQHSTNIWRGDGRGANQS